MAPWHLVALRCGQRHVASAAVRRSRSCCSSNSNNHGVSLVPNKGSEGARARLFSVVAEGLPGRSGHPRALGPPSYLTPIRYTSTTEATASAEETTDAADGQPQQEAVEPASRPRRDRNGPRKVANIGPFLSNMSNSIQRTNRVNKLDVRSALHILRTSKVRAVGPNGASLVLQCTGDVLNWLPRSQRAQLTQEVWAILESSGAHMDVSHYNMLLRVHLENDHAFSPTEFLAWMDGKGVTPNRVTYGYMIARFCNMGDMSSASSILEHMKASEMPLNESIFHSLITGHCKAGDAQAAADTRKVMTEQGLDVHAATHVAHFTGMIRGGKTWAEVRDEYRAVVDAGDIRFDDRKILKLILELVRAKELDGAKELAKDLPRAPRIGELLVNIMPQMIFEGGVDVALQLYDEFFFEFDNSTEVDDDATPDTSNSDNRRDRDNVQRGHKGLIIFNALAVAEHPPEEVVALIKKYETKNPSLSIQFLEECANLGKVDYGKRCLQIMKEKEPDIKVNDGVSILLFPHLAKVRSQEDSLRLFVDMVALGLVGFEMKHIDKLSRLVMPYFNLDDPMLALTEISRQSPKTKGLNWNHLCNAVICCLLRTGERENIYKALWCASRGAVVPYSNSWYIALNDAYLAHDDMLEVYSLFLTTINMKSNHAESIPNVLKNLYSNVQFKRPDRNADEVMREVLEALKKRHVCLDKEACAALEAEIGGNPENKALLEYLQNYEGGREVRWTEEKKKKFWLSITKYCEQHLGKTTEGGQPRMSDTRDTRDRPGPGPAIKRAIEQGRLEEAVALAKGAARDNYLFMKAIEALVEQGQTETAVDVFKSEISSERKQYEKTLQLIATAMVKEGRFDEMKLFLEEVDSDHLVKDKRGTAATHINAIARVLAVESKDPERVRGFVEFLLEKKFVPASPKNKQYLYSFVVEAHVEKGDREAAVSEFEDLNKTLNLCVKRRSLLCSLIKEQDTVNMQRVIDVTTEKYGEVDSLYQLMEAFLFVGQYPQVRKLMDTPGLRYNQDTVNYLVANLIGQDKLEALDKFVSLSKNIFGCDRDFLYRRLLEAHEDDADKVSDIWLLMQEEGVVASVKMKNIIRTACLNAGREDPFAVNPV